MYLIACLPVCLLLSSLPAYLVLRRYPRGSAHGAALALVPQILLAIALRQCEPWLSTFYPWADVWMDGWLTEPRMVIWLPWLMTVVGLAVVAVFLALAIPLFWFVSFKKAQ